LQIDPDKRIMEEQKLKNKWLESQSKDLSYSNGDASPTKNKVPLDPLL
jgi:hypothetical protein